jgi:hypothetical protein
MTTYYINDCGPEVNVLYSKHGWHIYWNLFIKWYRKWGIKLYWMPFSKYFALAFYFGKGEFVINFPTMSWRKK